MFDLLPLRLLCQNGCFVAYPFFVFRSYSYFCYLLVVKTLWALHYVVQGEGFRIVLIHGFGASAFQILSVCVFFLYFIYGFMFLDLDLCSFCSCLRHI